jgi:hypothetical protein
MLVPAVYARDFGALRLVVVWREGVTVARWWNPRTGAPFASVPVGKA